MGCAGWRVGWVLGHLLLLTQARIQDCEQSHKKDMVENFINCTGEHKNEYSRMMEEDNVDKEKVTCHFVTSLVDTCGELWGLCHSREEVRRMKALQVESLVLKNSESEVDIEKCLVVSKYRGEMTSSKSEGLCSEEEESEIRFEFQICSHNTSTKLFQEIQELSNQDQTTMESVCKALKDLSEECIGYLLECFLEEDLLEVKKLHFKEVIDTLLNFDNKSINEEDIFECEAVKEIMNSDLEEALNEESER